MIIRYTTVLKSRFDAPYVGTLIAGPYCYGNCSGCFNQHLKSLPVSTIDSEEFLQSVVDDPFSEGIILGGLEWLDAQYDEVLCLLDGAKKYNLKAMLYTRQTENYLRTYYPELFTYTGLYIKVGEYDENKRVNNYVSHDVVLSSSNQYILEVS